MSLHKDTKNEKDSSSDQTESNVENQSDHKRAEELEIINRELRKAEEKYRIQFEGSLDAIFLANVETGILIDCNPAATRLVERDRSELIGRHQRILHPPEDIDGQFSITFKKHIEEKQGQALETQVITKNGQIKDVAITAAILDIDGKKVLQGIFRDNTEQKLAEKELKKTLSLHTATLESTADGILVVDLEGKVVSFNNKFLQLWNIPESLIEERDDDELLEYVLEQLSDPEDFLTEVRRLYSNPEESSHDILKFKDGRVFERLSQPQKIDENIAGRVWSFRDITERRKAEEQQVILLKQLEKTNRELNDVVYIMSHDLKTPLRGISTLADWLLTDYADKFDERGKHQMGLLLNRVGRINNLIEGILQYSRIGRIKEEKTKVNLEELIPKIIDMISPPDNIRIITENKLPVIQCERTEITQVFRNLLSNAVKYIDKPQGLIRIGCIEDDDCWEFSIADNGRGIKEKYFEKIFGIFQTLSLRDESESTGVGLTVVKKIVELYGGRVWVVSKPGEGSTFFFTLRKMEAKLKPNQFPLKKH